jgi:glycosyltransferase involved in cell wall biosynthesis
MRVAIVIDSLARGGAERQAIHAARELGRSGCDVELIHYRHVARTYDELSFGAATSTYLPKDGRYSGFVRVLYRHFRQRRVDVVHAFLGTPTLYACTAARCAGVPVVLGGIRGLYDSSGLVQLGHRCLNWIVNGWIVNSRASAGSLVAQIGANPAKVFVVYNGVDPQSFAASLSMPAAKHRLGIDPACPVVSIFAVLRPEKNHRLFLETATCIVKTMPQTRFLVAGDGAGRLSLEAYARDLGLAQSVQFLGNRTDIAELLAATDVSVLTSHYEGLPNALLEAMAATRPIVCTRFAGVEELVSDGDDGLIADLGDRDGLALRIMTLLRDPSSCGRLGANGRRTVRERFSMDAMGRNLLAVYDTCFSRAAASRNDPQKLKHAERNASARSETAQPAAAHDDVGGKQILHG